MMYDESLAQFKDLDELLDAASNDFGDFHRHNTVSLKREILENSLSYIVQHMLEESIKEVFGTKTD